MPLGSILIAQQDRIVTRFLATALSYFGYRVICAADGQQARTFFDRYAPELMLMLVDTVLPDASGLRFVEDLPTRSPRIPVIFVSGLGEAEEAPTLRSNFPVLQKPFTVWQLVRGAKAAIARFCLDARSKGLVLRAAESTNTLS
jgi:two-component system cell cycle sensor histidine kinase/response regulator CckA